MRPTDPPRHSHPTPDPSGTYMHRLLSVMILAAILITGCGPADPVESTRDALEAAVDSIAASHTDATVAVSVRDGALHYDRLGDRLFHAASTMKVPVMIEIFRLVEAGRLSLDDSLLVQNALSNRAEPIPTFSGRATISLSSRRMISAPSSLRRQHFMQAYAC